jgi:UDP-N-acetylmuramyl pentapeptide synthase
MNASVKLLASAHLTGRLFLMLGGMRELGDISRDAHQDLLDFIAAELPQASVLTIGKEFDGISPLHFSTPESAEQYLQDNLKPGDTVFAKGSRGNAVEKCLPPEAR